MNNRRNILFILFIFLFQNTVAQNGKYEDSISAYQKNYVETHEVVGKDDRQFIRFYDVDEDYQVSATFERIADKVGFDMNTSSGKKKLYYKYGRVTFKIKDTLIHLFIYQSASLMHQEQYKDYLFLPFGDSTSGFESYGGGRYLDLTIGDIKNNRVILDFNKAYNPYCAYTTGYNCPIPPLENLLQISIPVGEKNYAKAIH